MPDVERREKSVGHHHLLYRHGSSVVHRLPAQTKIVAVVAFVLAVVATPATQRWAFASYAIMLLIVCALAKVPLRWLLPRLLVETPFVIFAVLLPFLAQGPKTIFLGLTVSESGLESAFAILTKGTLGVAASLLLAATTELRALLVGLHQLKVPPLMVQIMAFMLRYLDVVAAEWERMRIARTSRCFGARKEGRLKIMAAAAAALFIRAYERGERVHLAMLSRGYSGGLPVLEGAGATPLSWARAAVLPAAAALVATSAWVLR